MLARVNLNANTAWRYSGISNRNTAKTLEKLASGFKLNRAADDAAGLAVSQKMRTMIRESVTCEKNTRQGVDAANTADGALEEINAMLTRARELCVQASNGTFDEDDRIVIEDEVRQILDEIDRITESTHYNNIKLLRWDGVGSLAPISGYDVTGEVVPSSEHEWGAINLPGIPSTFADTTSAKAAQVTMSLDASINFNDLQSLEGKTVTLPTGSSSSVTYTFSQYTGSDFSERYSGSNAISINSYASVQAALESLATRSTIISDAKVNVSDRTITFTSALTTGTETLYNMRVGNPHVFTNVNNPYDTGAAYNNRVFSSSGTFLKPLGGTYARSGLKFAYGDASLKASLLGAGAIVSDGTKLTQAQVDDLTFFNNTVSPSRHQIEINVLGTTKTITFSTTGGTAGTVSGNSSSQNIVIAAGMDGADLRNALTTAFAGLGMTATWSGTTNPALTLEIAGSNMNASSWGAITLREVRVYVPGTSGSPEIPYQPEIRDPEPKFLLTRYSKYAESYAGLSITTTSSFLSEASKYLHEISVPTAQEIKAAVAALGASGTPLALGGLMFYDSAYDYAPKNQTWTAPNPGSGKYAEGGSDSGTTDFTMNDYYSGGININGLSDEAIMNYVNNYIYSVTGMNLDANGKAYVVNTSPSYNISNSTNLRMSFRQYIDTGRTIVTPEVIGVPGSPGTPAEYSTVSIFSSSYQYFTREASVPSGSDVLQIPLDASGNVDLTALAGSGFQLTIQTNPTSSTATAQRLYEFRTSGTNGAYDSATGTYIINIGGCVTPEDVATRMEAAIKSATGANDSADVSVSWGADGKIAISSSYMAYSSSFYGLYNDGAGKSGLFGAGTVSGAFSGGTKDALPGTVVDFSSIDSSNITDLIGTGFRISCGTCTDEYFNVLFVENLNELGNISNISTYTDTAGATYYNYFVELNASNITSSFDSSDVVADIVSQLTPQMQNHFTSVSAGPSGNTLVVSDKRYAPNGMGSVIPGVYTNFDYNFTIETLYGLPPEDLQYMDLPIYVSSVGPQHVINLHLPHLTLDTLKLDEPPALDFTSIDNANAWLNKVVSAAQEITGVRAVFGADTNRLKSAFNTLSNNEVQFVSSEAAIRDLDMAKEMATLTKQQIITQAAQSMLAQANQLPQGILELLR